ncbi:MAG: U32 family peptidase [Desulfocapsaceae bacterium]|nr:U32 family peptidase [Desulfocapsaceae bacterium]
MNPRTLELLSPARDCATGMAAIDHGADAVYIGAPKFSARAAAANSIAEIRELTNYAHRFHARVYAALNTLLNNREIREAAGIAAELHSIGVDALIIQDMGLLECDLPPIPLHASTQCDNRTAEKVRFLEDTGFTQVVLARELNLEQIAAIRKSTSVPLEFFVHGALCVSYSGRCTMSEVVADRSANRGNCAQFCRHRYTLKDGDGNILKKGSHLLSLQDLDLSGHLRQLIDAGISSFKIEGRLKDISTVKNLTAFYRQTLDRIIAADHNLRRASSGRCTFDFSPDPARTFHRGGTDYFLTTQRNRPGALKTPKSTGARIGRVGTVTSRFFTLESPYRIANGDGLCFFDADENLVGLRVNRLEGERIYPRDPVAILPGTIMYRNLDTAFINQLKHSGNCRKIAAGVTITGTAAGLDFAISDEDGCHTSVNTSLSGEKAQNPDRMLEILIQQARKSGSTIFTVEEVSLNMDPIPHIPMSTINDIRRRALAAHLETRLRRHPLFRRPLSRNAAPWPASLGSPQDLANGCARTFYRRHGADLAAKPSTAERHTVLMTCKYCIKAQLNLCPIHGLHTPGPTEPLTITDNTGTYDLAFDCRKCEMTVLLRTEEVRQQKCRHADPDAETNSHAAAKTKSKRDTSGLM